MWRHSTTTTYCMKHIFNLIFGQSGTIIDMHSNFFIKSFGPISCSWIAQAYASKWDVMYLLQVHCLLSSLSISGNCDIYLLTYLCNGFCKYWVFIRSSNDLRYFWLISFGVNVFLSSVSNLSNSSFLSSLFCLAHVQQHIFDNDFYEYY